MNNAENLGSSHVPVCGECARSMTVEENGVTLEAQADGRPYYLIQADRYRCPGCGFAVYSEFGRKVMHYHERFDLALDHHPERVVIK